MVIGTPKELLLMVERGGLKYKNVEMVVVDEVNACTKDKALQERKRSGAMSGG